MTDRYRKFAPQMLPGMTECITLPALQDGNMPSISPDGETALSGQDLAPASHSRLPGNKKATKTSATSGQKCFGSSESVALQSSLENRLQERFGTDGSILFKETWKRRVTPSGVSYLEHTARARRTSDSVYTGWPTARANDAEKRGNIADDPRNGLVTAANLAGSLTPKLPSGGGCERNSQGGGLRKLEDQVILAGVGDSIIKGLEGHSGDETRLIRQVREISEQDRSTSSPSSYQWRAVEWLPCRDGKSRPTESTVLGLADGVPDSLGYVRSGEKYILSPLSGKSKNRVGRLKGYGNAIVPQVAAEFIKSYMEATE